MSNGIGSKTEDYVALIFDKKDQTPKAWAVMNFSANIIRTRTEVTFPYTVEFNLAKPPILSKSGDRLRYEISFAPGHHPKPFSEAKFDFSDSDNYSLSGKLPASLKHSAYVLLLLAQHGFEAGVKHETDITSPKTGFLKSETFCDNPNFKVTRMTHLKWMTAWQWALWEENSLSRPERFESMKAIALHYKLEPWNCLSTFGKWLAAIRNGKVQY